MEPVALFVCPRGPYPSKLADWYDETRNALTYSGQAPVVAHPPCGPWGRLFRMCTKQDPRHAIWAVWMVRILGGVLEHPKDSKLWKVMGLPKPGERERERDQFGGWSVQVRQVSWGHPCEKATWLYMVG